MNRFFEIEDVQRPIEDVRSDLFKLNNAKLASLLFKTDWCVVRAVDPTSKKEISQEIVAQRQAYREQAAAVESEIASATTHNKLLLIFENHF
jgi:hypothetical protein